MNKIDVEPIFSMPESDQDTTQPSLVTPAVVDGQSVGRGVTRKRFLRLGAGLLLGGALSAAIGVRRLSAQEASLGEGLGEDGSFVGPDVVVSEPTIPLVGIEGLKYPNEDLIWAAATKFHLNPEGLTPDGMSFETRINYNDPNKPYIVFGREPQTREIMLATRLDQRSGELVWNIAGLRDLSDALGLYHGANSGYWLFEDPQARDIFINEVNLVTIDSGLYWKEIEPKRGRFDFRWLDRQINQWSSMGMRLRGHALVYPTAEAILPEWLRAGGFSREELIGILVNHVREIVFHGKGKIQEWVAVNEPFLPTYRENDIFHKVIGPESIEIAFQIARETDPSAVLIFNDTDNHTKDGTTTANTKKIVEDLKRKGLIDVVGVQAHLGDWVKTPQTGDMITTLKNYGVPAVVTEFDYNLKKVAGLQQDRYQQQAQMTQMVFEASMVAGVTEFSHWDFFDRYSWLTRGTSDDFDPTLFDRSLQAKPNYFALRRVLDSFLDVSK